jgi:large-conductance mechanosensitive channel
VDWIERLFGISPDGGNGYFEWVIVAFVVFLVVAAVWRRLRRVASSNASHPSATAPASSSDSSRPSS